MQRICAWCRTLLGEAPGGDPPAAAPTHGICERCRDNLETQLGVSLERFLATLPEPVIVVDGDCRFVDANQPALDLMGKNLFRCSGLPAGDVFECAHARLPEGCGRTIHCNGCVIRASVSETWRTGNECIDVPAVLNRHPSHADNTLYFRISTKKVNNLILLKIELAAPPEAQRNR